MATCSCGKVFQGDGQYCPDCKSALGIATGSAKDSPPEHPASPTVGSLIKNRYRIEGPVGQGSMSVVYRGIDLEDGSTVAVRFLRPERNSSRARERFRREAAFAMKVRHPNIPEVYASGEINGAAYMVMRFIHGDDLKQLVETYGPLDPQVVLSTAIQVAGALDTAHQVGMIHRDLKSPNILREGNHAWVIDFGIARFNQAPRLTTAGIAVGTPAYMAPEVARGIDEIDGRADIYSLGVTLFEILAGELPFYDDDPLRLLEMHVRKRPPPLADKRAGLPDSVVELVHTCLAKRRENRYQDARELRSALETCLRDVLSTPRPFRVALGEVGFLVIGMGNTDEAHLVAQTARDAGIGVRMVPDATTAFRQLSETGARVGILSDSFVAGVNPPAQGAPVYIVGGQEGDGFKHIASPLDLKWLQSLVDRLTQAHRNNGGGEQGQ